MGELHAARRASDYEDDGWVEPGNTVICDPNGDVVAGPLRHEEGILTAEVDLTGVHEMRRLFDPVGHYSRPDVFRLLVDTRKRPAVTVVSDENADSSDLSETQRAMTEQAASLDCI